jgi:hypothetical protein
MAARLGVASIEKLEAGDPGAAVKLAFGSKLATEAGRIATPAADKPGTVMLAFIQSLQPTPLPTASETTPRGALGPVVDLEALAPAPDGPHPAPDEMTRSVETDADPSAEPQDAESPIP